MSSIDPNLYVGSLEAAKDNTWILQTAGINAIIGFLSPNVAFPYSDAVRSTCEINFFRIEDGDPKFVTLFFESVNKMLRRYLNDKKKVLVHCNSGQSRSVSAALLYAMHEKGLSLKVSFFSYSVVNVLLNAEESSFLA